ncbi:MAG: metallophosphoesterase family protein [Candidatus Methanomethylophilaceae archaeon]|nr:metallophosphoesterase family protein [Candidatus Methanomethylophilaceae archaeon]
MRFLVITDLHQKRADVGWINEEIAAHKAEFVLFLGDITNFGTKKLAKEIISKIDSKVYAIPGNCDPLDLPEGIKDVAVDMHGNAAEVGGYRIVGLGGSNITIFHTAFELEEDELYNGLKKNTSEGMILMTHAPSYGILDQIPSGISVGSRAIKRIVDEYHPILALSGHIHEASGIVEQDGTVFVNPGPAKEKKFAVIDIDGGKVRAEILKH